MVETLRANDHAINRKDPLCNARRATAFSLSKPPVRVLHLIRELRDLLLVTGRKCQRYFTDDL